MVRLIVFGELDAEISGFARGSGFGFVSQSMLGMGGGGNGMDTTDSLDGTRLTLEECTGRPSSSSLKSATPTSSTSLKKNYLKTCSHFLHCFCSVVQLSLDAQ